MKACRWYEWLKDRSEWNYDDLQIGARNEQLNNTYNAKLSQNAINSKLKIKYIDIHNLFNADPET